MLSDQETRRRARLAARGAARLSGMLSSCVLCPRLCAVDRTRGATGLCRLGAKARVARFGPVWRDEAPLVGPHGSGTVHFNGCALRCAFCADAAISQTTSGREVEPEELAEIFLALQRRGCHNLNLVSPSHVTPAIAAALAIAYEDGLVLPVVYTSGGYERAEVLAELAGLVDVYLIDFKWGVDRQHSQAPGYNQVCRAAIREMHRQVGDLVTDHRGLAQRGLMVRHLALPGDLGNARAVAQFLAREISTHTWCRVLDSYRPVHRAAAVPELARRTRAAEVEAARQAFRDAGLHRLVSGAGRRASGLGRPALVRPGAWGRSTRL